MGEKRKCEEYEYEKGELETRRAKRIGDWRKIEKKEGKKKRKNGKKRVRGRNEKKKVKTTKQRK